MFPRLSCTKSCFCSCSCSCQPAACHVAAMAAASCATSIKIMTLSYMKKMISILNSFQLSSSTRVRSVEIIINFNFGHRNYADTLHWPYIAILTAWLMPGLPDPDICLAFLRLIAKPIESFCISSAITNYELQTTNGWSQPQSNFQPQSQSQPQPQSQLTNCRCSLNAIGDNKFHK